VYVLAAALESGGSLTAFPKRINLGQRRFGVIDAGGRVESRV
jgi:hypothetical protein